MVARADVRPIASEKLIVVLCPRGAHPKQRQHRTKIFLKAELVVSGNGEAGEAE